MGIGNKDDELLTRTEISNNEEPWYEKAFAVANNAESGSADFISE